MQPTAPRSHATYRWLVLLVYGLLALMYWGSFADDAFIVARYAANLISGEGLLFNPGERINVLTSPLHVFLLLPFEWLSSNAVKAYTVACGFLTVAVVCWAAARLFSQSLQRLFFLAGVLLFPPLVFWSIGGLETPIFTLLLTVLCVVWSRQGGHASQVAAVLALATLCVLVRYDAVLIVAAPALYALYRGRHEPRVWLTVLLLAGLLLCWFLGVLWYYGDLLPNSYYVKSLRDGLLERLRLGAGYELSFLALLLFPLATAFVTGRAKPPRNKAPARDAKPAYHLWPILVGLLLYGAYGLLASTVHMMYLYRLLVPLVPILMWLVVLSLPNTPKPIGLVALVLVQLTVAWLVHERSMNFNLSLLLAPQSSGREWYEFSLAGARQSNQQANVAFAKQAEALRAHWQEHGNPQTQPRLAVWTEGQPPYHLPDFYVYGPLVSYRHTCKIEFAPHAHYRQDIRYLPDDAPAAVDEPGWQLVSSKDLPIREWGGEQRRIRLLLFYQEQVLRHPLPDEVGEPCR